MLQRAHEQVMQQPLQSNMSTTVTDGGWLEYFGIPTILYGPGDLTEAHSVDEKIKVEELEQFAQVLEAFLKSWYASPQKD